jgi:hypothetical protein
MINLERITCKTNNKITSLQFDGNGWLLRKLAVSKRFYYICAIIRGALFVRRIEIHLETQKQAEITPIKEAKK